MKDIKQEFYRNAVYISILSVIICCSHIGNIEANRFNNRINDIYYRNIRNKNSSYNIINAFLRNINNDLYFCILIDIKNVTDKNKFILNTISRIVKKFEEEYIIIKHVNVVNAYSFYNNIKEVFLRNKIKSVHKYNGYQNEFSKLDDEICYNNVLFVNKDTVHISLPHYPIYRSDLMNVSVENVIFLTFKRKRS